MKTILSVLVLLIILAGLLAWLYREPVLVPTVTPTPTIADQNFSEDELRGIFSLDKKEAETELYYSDNLGVGFTYMPRRPDISGSITVTETSNKIYVHAVGDDPERGQSIEVFTKNPEISFEEAIVERFLMGYEPKDCFVKTQEANETELESYKSAIISYPPPSSDDVPWWENSEKCPKVYSATNGITYFLFNNDVPGRYIFVAIGQYSITSDGTPRTEQGGFNWSHSIRILR